MKIKRVSVPWGKSRKGKVLVELSERLLKLAQVAEEGGGRKIVYLNALELDPQDEEKFSKELSELLKHLPRRIGEVYASLPRSQMTTRIFLLPSTQPQELAKMVEFQIEKEIPFPKDKIIFDYSFIETTPDGYTRLLLVIAGEEVIRRSLALLKKSGLTPNSLFFSSQGLASWFDVAQKEQKEEDKFFALVDIDRFVTHVEILRHGQLYFTRSFVMGSHQIEGEGESTAQDAFVQELNRTLGAFKKEFPEAKIDKLFLSGISKPLASMQGVLASQLACPVETIDFKQHCPLGGLTAEGIEEKASFASSVGFLLKDEKRIDLIPPSEKRARRDRLFRKILLQLVLLGLGSLFLLGLTFGTTLQKRRTLLVSLQKELHELEPTATQIESMERQLLLLGSRDTASETILELLRELYRLIPEDVTLTYLLMDPDRISVRGSSKSLQTVFLFAKGLESSPLLKTVQVKNATRRTISQGEVTIFQITASVTRQKEEKS